VAVFSVIFAPEAEPCVREMLRVVRPGGRLVITSWLAEGAINDVAQVLSPPGARPESPWPFADKVRDLFAAYPVAVSIEEAALSFESPSAAAWFADVESNHPFWRLMKTTRAEQWPELRARSLEILEGQNESDDGFRCTSKYLLTRVDRR
jgi:SAM-dependent methyltransferase